ncbi:pectate lyase family protein [Sorangium sp. So ce406]|uniref:pectate lyase family protein n=1 Tax=Sorangium sp. So ce406 TaxID=3133311 RepID=UPI003F5BC901
MNRKTTLLWLFGGVFTAAVSCSSNDESESSEAGGTSSTTGGSSGSGGSQVGVGVSGSTASGSGGSGGNMMSGSGASVGSGGSGASVGSGGSGGSGGGDGGAGADHCEPIGWATRSGRDGNAFHVTGGGDAEPIVVDNFADLLEYAKDGQARVIHIDGTLGGGWSGTSGDRLEIKSNKTIVGLRAGTQLKAAIHIKDASNVILRNIVVRGPGSNGDQAWDNINIEGNSRNIWVDHAEFWDGQDGNADVVKGADNVTFTWSIFGYSKRGSHNLSNLIASSDNEPASEGKLNITFMFNWWTGVSERQPRCRYGRIHVVNNLYTADTSAGPSKLGVTNGFKCNVLTENNHFIDQSQPIDLGKQAGEGSVQEATGNLFEGCSGNQEGSGDAFEPPYEYKSFMVPASEVKELVQAHAGATLSSPTACSP